MSDEAGAQREDLSTFPPEVWDLVGGPSERAGLEHFAALLAAEGELRGLIGPRELPRLWSRHLINSLPLTGFVPSGASVADVGSGAGLPGLVLAITRPDVPTVLIETMERRCEWLRYATEQLGLENVRVINARAEELHGTESFDVVTARAVARLDKLIPWTVPLVKAGGAVIALKGERAQLELDAAAKALKKYRVQSAQVHEIPSPLDGEITRLVELRV